MHSVASSRGAGDVALEHSTRAIDRYNTNFRQVFTCKTKGLTVQETAHATQCIALLRAAARAMLLLPLTWFAAG